MIPAIKESTQFKVFLGIHARFPDLCGGEAVKKVDDPAPRKDFKIIGDFLNKQKGLSTSFQALNDETQPRMIRHHASHSEYPAQSQTYLNQNYEDISVPFQTQDAHLSDTSLNNDLMRRESQEAISDENYEDIV